MHAIDGWERAVLCIMLSTIGKRIIWTRVGNKHIMIMKNRQPES